MKTGEVCKRYDISPNLIAQWMQRGLIGIKRSGKGNRMKWSFMDRLRLRRFLKYRSRGYRLDAASELAWPSNKYGHLRTYTTNKLTIIDEAQPVDPKIREWIEKASKDPDNHPLLNRA